MGEVIQLQGDQRKDVQEFLVAKDGLELDVKTIKVCIPTTISLAVTYECRSMVSRRFSQRPTLLCPR